MRKMAKVVNYSSLYGVGASKLARESAMTEKEAKRMLDAFWVLNWSVREAANSQFVKTLKDGSKWVKNPVSGFYYSLRNSRDTWSTINQGTGVFIFDSWLMRVRRKGVIVPFQYHDELMTLRKVATKTREEVEDSLHKSMKEVNESLNLNVEIRVDVAFGENYAEVH